MTKEPVLRFTEALVRLAHLVQQVFVDVSKEYELTPQQAQLLCLLIGGPVGMTELTRSLHLEKSSLTGLVDRAEKRGLVARTRDSHDRRTCRIALTPEGERIGALAHDGMTERLEALARELPQQHRDLLASVIGEILTEHTAQTGRAWLPSGS
ncbi:MarR family winged helix-turn-helix transcriptional regulator [Nonomuraea basaltis]|uniref:MarR family winged helix-turn-helix transcriptional regulator n=1 Tax=Nonomuraea basaltis TaxID=2495887 RepID=UPI00110C4335|nr:MarR family transcriptional regulator [Nonomuraea basaltis]TMR88261.1 MarR family transcriptional regulator [Nonomuraea basaltis]